VVKNTGRAALAHCMTMTTVPPVLPNTAVGRRIRWYIERLRNPVPPSDGEVEANFEPSAKVWVPPLRDERAWTMLAASADGLAGGTITVHSETRIDLEGATPEGRRWRYRFATDPVTTRFVEFALEWVQEEDVSVRAATEVDGPVLADIERRSPMILGDTSVTIDRGDDYFAAARLMEDVSVMVAEVDGVPAAVQCAAARTVGVGGRAYRLGYFHHLRILPEHQRKGLFQKLNQSLSGRYMPPHVDGTYAYVSPDNAASQRLFSFAQAWSVQPLMCKLPVGELRGPRLGRLAMPTDAEHVVEMINTWHGGEEMFWPYSREFLASRLERAPRQYGWSSLLVTDGAVVGVWPAGDSFTTIVESPSERAIEREGFVLDEGVVPGAETDYESLLRSWCTELDDRGFTSLVTFTSPGSPSYPLLTSLNGEMQPFDLFVFGPEHPDGADERGVHVDLIYF
jgi:hypothetical protein